ncbi:hypothetical protein HDU98_004157 [Podochytrium sp. JEL0797]|nr:hypothetical protein HDU98_004157 [Podochytrium sp. JEL0797]
MTRGAFKAAAPPPTEKQVTWVIAEADVNRKLMGTNEAAKKETLIGALNASGVFHMDRPNAHFNKESKENNKFAIVVTKTNEDRDCLVGSGFGIIAGNGVIISTKPENEQECNDRKYGKQLQLAALPTNANAAALEECRQWIGAKSVQIPPNPYTETTGSVAIFEFETTQQVDMIINDKESRKVDLSDGKTRTLFRTWKKNGNAFERQFNKEYVHDVVGQHVVVAIFIRVFLKHFPKTLLENLPTPVT